MKTSDMVGVIVGKYAFLYVDSEHCLEEVGNLAKCLKPGSTLSISSPLFKKAKGGMYFFVWYHTVEES